MRALLLILLLISCQTPENDSLYAICEPYYSMDCELVDENEWELYREQYQICEVEKNERDCLNIYNF